MLCHHCSKPTRVLTTDTVGKVTWRKRECPNGHRFVTEETYQRDVADYRNRGTTNDYGWMLAGDR